MGKPCLKNSIRRRPPADLVAHWPDQQREPGPPGDGKDGQDPAYRRLPRSSLNGDLLGRRRALRLRPKPRSEPARGAASPRQDGLAAASRRLRPEAARLPRPLATRGVSPWARGSRAETIARSATGKAQRRSRAGAAGPVAQRRSRVCGADGRDRPPNQAWPSWPLGQWSATSGTSTWGARARLPLARGEHGMGQPPPGPGASPAAWEPPLGLTAVARQTLMPRRPVCNARQR